VYSKRTPKKNQTQATQHAPSRQNQGQDGQDGRLDLILLDSDSQGFNFFVLPGSGPTQTLAAGHEDELTMLTMLTVIDLLCTSYVSTSIRTSILMYFGERRNRTK
jgi:hypothetical protein